MKTLRILSIGMVFVAIGIYYSAIPTPIFGEDLDSLAQLTTTPGTKVTPGKSKLDCKWVEEKDKDGKIIYKLIGKDCPKLEQEVNSQQKALGKACCVCRREGGIIVCRGECCIELFTKASR